MKVADCMILILGAWQKSLLLIAQSLFSILTGFYKLHTVKGGGKWQNYSQRASRRNAQLQIFLD